MTNEARTFTSTQTSEDLQKAINAEEGRLVITVPWVNTRGYESVAPGDPAVIEVSDPEDHSAWIADVLDVEFEEGYPMTVLLNVR